MVYLYYTNINRYTVYDNIIKLFFKVYSEVLLMCTCMYN